MNSKISKTAAGVFVCVCCFGFGAKAATYKQTLTIMPNEHVSWTQSLEPSQDAEAKFVAGDPPPKGYVYAGMTAALQNSPGFCWTLTNQTDKSMTYHIINTLGKSAESVVKATCTWVPAGDEGEGPPGPPPPVLKGDGTATGVAQPATYWNTAEGSNVLAIGSSALVKAFKDAGAPADSTWSSSGGVSVDSSEGTSTKATGVEASQSAWDANVHSVSKDYPTLSDDESFTVVKVVSITAEPAVVCVGNSNIAYTITTQPGGFEYMVQYTPADVSTPGVKEVVATCGTSAATCTVTAIKVELNSFSIEKGADMSFAKKVVNGNTFFGAYTGRGPIAGAYFDGIATLLPENLEINFELQCRQYQKRLFIITLDDGLVITNVFADGWDHGGKSNYASTNFPVSGTHHLQADDSPSIEMNITAAYNDGVRAAVFSDIFDLYFDAGVPSVCYKNLGMKKWGLAFAFVLSTNELGEVDYMITDRKEIGEIP